MRMAIFVSLIVLVFVFFSNGKCSKEGLKMDEAEETKKSTTGVYVDLNDYTEEGRSAIHVAIESNQLEIVKSFIEEEIYDVNFRDQNGCTLLFYAVTSPHDIKSKLQMMKYLIEKGAHVNAAAKTGASVLHLAALYGDTEIIAFLLENGAHLNAKDNKGLTPFEYAVQKENNSIRSKNSSVTVMTEKLESGIDTNSRDNEELKTLDSAESKGRLDKMKHVEL